MLLLERKILLYFSTFYYSFNLKGEGINTICTLDYRNFSFSGVEETRALIQSQLFIRGEYPLPIYSYFVQKMIGWYVNES